MWMKVEETDFSLLWCLPNCLSCGSRLCLVFAVAPLNLQMVKDCSVHQKRTRSKKKNECMEIQKDCISIYLCLFSPLCCETGVINRKLLKSEDLYTLNFLRCTAAAHKYPFIKRLIFRHALDNTLGNPKWKSINQTPSKTFKTPPASFQCPEIGGATSCVRSNWALMNS